MIDQFIAAMLGTLAFVIIFNVPRKEYLYCAVNGGIGWLTYLFLFQHSSSIVISSLGATLFLTLSARILSIIRRCPVTIFLVTGIFVLVPGAGIYYTAYYLITNELAQAGVKGLETFKIAGAIVIGIIFGFAIPQGWLNRLQRNDNK